MMNGKRLAQIAHGELIERLAENQETLLKIKALRDAYGDDALPPNKIMRSHNNALANAKESMRSFEAMTLERIAEYTATIREIEAALKADDDASIEAFARDMAARMKAGRAETEAAKPKWRTYRENGKPLVFGDAEPAHMHIHKIGLNDARIAKHDGAWMIEVLR